MAKIDELQLIRELSEEIKINNSLKKDIYDEVAHPYFNEIKSEFLKEFDESKVTEEISGGESGPSLTNATDGYGNLYSFIGFEKGDDPIKEARSYLDANTYMGSYADVEIKNKKIVFNYPNVSIPTEADLNEHFPVPERYQRNGWLIAIEKGFSNLAHYIFSQKGFPPKANSRSGTGRQAENAKQGEVGQTFHTQEYLPSFLKRLRNKLSAKI